MALLILFLCYPILSFSQDFDFNNNCRVAYNEIISLKLDKGKMLLQAERERHPQNLIPVYLENYVDFLQLFVSTDEKTFDSLKELKDKRISALGKGDKNAPYYLYTQAEIYLQWGIIKIRFEEYFSAFFDLRRAYKLLEENIEKHPGFPPNQKSFGLLKALLGTIPSKYEWGIRLFGMEGDLKQGMDMLNTLLDQEEDFIFHDEVINIYSSLLFHLEGKPDEAWQVLKEVNYPIEGNLFSFYTTAKIALYSKHNDEAIQIINSAPTGKAYPDFPILEYYLGVAWLNKLDIQSIKHFEDFIKNNNGKDLIKSAYHKIAWAYLIHDNPDQYNFYLQKIRECGRAETEADKQAEKEAKADQPPDVMLLKARLLFDGGYLAEAFELLQNKEASDYALFQHQLELVYRKGRILDAMNKESEAIKYYEQTIDLGENAPYYYAANSALNLAFIYESKGNIAKAKYYYTKCMEMDNHEYRLSLNQKAKAGLQRLKP